VRTNDCQHGRGSSNRKDKGRNLLTSVSLYVELKAKPGKEEEVAAFLAGAQGLVATELGTVAWFAVRCHAPGSQIGSAGGQAPDVTLTSPYSDAIASRS